MEIPFLVIADDVESRTGTVSADSHNYQEKVRHLCVTSKLETIIIGRIKETCLPLLTDTCASVNPQLHDLAKTVLQIISEMDTNSQNDEFEPII